jgi:hypothetical protein
VLLVGRNADRLAGRLFVSNFDEAFRRQQAQERAAYAAQQAEGDRRAREADAAAGLLEQMVRDFARTLVSRLTRVSVEVTDRQ